MDLGTRVRQGYHFASKHTLPFGLDIPHLCAMSEPPTNTPEFTVSELASALKRTIEESFGVVRLRGEISNYRGPHSSGHAYFCLKDQNARIDAVIWKGTFARLKTKPEEGLEVITSGKVTTFPGKSAYQIVIESLEPAGVGALMALLEERRCRLAAEGLFDEARKRALPFLPATIGVVTSPTGAVIRDILHRIGERFPRHVLVWPVRVQGETCAAEVAAAIDGFNALPVDGAPRRPDVIIVARCGGSLEDLWGFNEEIVVRAAAAGRVPLIAALGHETDWTLIDLVADLRAPTPTGAAEKAVPVLADLMTMLTDLGRRHAGAALRFVAGQRAEWRSLTRALPRADKIVALPRQGCDRAGARLTGLFAASLDRRHIDFGRLGHRLASQSPQAKMAGAAQRLDALEHRLRRSRKVVEDRRRQEISTLHVRLKASLASRARIEAEKIAASRQRIDGSIGRMRRALAADIARRRSNLIACVQLLGSLGYRQVLARGFALVRDAEAQPLRLAAEVVAGAALDIEFADGHRSAIAGDAPTREVPAQTKPTPVQTKRKSVQGSLF
jgi:exodeoxyribonuclease VII large subunit